MRAILAHTQIQVYFYIAPIYCAARSSVRGSFVVHHCVMPQFRRLHRIPFARIAYFRVPAVFFSSATSASAGRNGQKMRGYNGRKGGNRLLLSYWYPNINTYLPRPWTVTNLSITLVRYFNNSWSAYSTTNCLTSWYCMRVFQCFLSRASSRSRARKKATSASSEVLHSIIHPTSCVALHIFVSFSLQW